MNRKVLVFFVWVKFCIINTRKLPPPLDGKELMCRERHKTESTVIWSVVPALLRDILQVGQTLVGGSLMGQQGQ